MSDWKTHHPPALCPRGSYCDSATKTRLPCPKGKYNPDSGQEGLESCINCLDGYYNPMEGQQVCPFQCPPGTFGKHSNDGQTIVADSVVKCKECPLGTFCPGQGNVDPTQCPRGKHEERQFLGLNAKQTAVLMKHVLRTHWGYQCEQLQALS